MAEVLEVQCNVCFGWFPQDHEDAARQGIQAWTQHHLEDHPEGNVAQMLDSLLLEAILNGRTMSGEES
jgi:hypothetical protein